jgi:hypothetical protein
VSIRAPFCGIGQVACPSNPPPPAGSTPWLGAVPADVTSWAKDILADSDTYPMFAEVRANIGGAPVVAQVQHHTTRGATGETGLCIRGISIFNDAAGSTASTNAMLAPGSKIVSAWQSQSPTVRAIELVFLGFVAVGTTFAIVNALLQAER